MKLTENFTLEELYASPTADRLGIDNTPSPLVRQNLRLLAEKILQPIRNEYRHAIIVNSGYRCQTLNKVVGRAKTSQHLTGCAADITTWHDKPEENKQLFELIKLMHQNEELPSLKQCLDEYGYNWIHISYQDGRTAKYGQFLHLK